MKKILTNVFLFILIICLTCSCEKKEYQLIELTTKELLNNISNNKNFVFAMYNSNINNSKDFKEALENIIKNTKTNIYYLDFQHLSVDAGSLLITLFDIEPSQNSYYVVKDGKFVISNQYTDFKDLYKNLKNYKFSQKIDFIQKKEKEKSLKEAQELYNKGYISLSIEKLNQAWNLKEAKEFYEKSSYYQLIGEWEYYDYKDKKIEKIDYYSLVFISDTTYFYKAKKSGNFTNFKKPTYSEYTSVYYYIIDDYIKVAEKENSKYTKKYKILYLDEKNLHLEDLSTKKEIKYTKG